MSVTFKIRGTEIDLERWEVGFMHLNHANAQELLEWLDYQAPVGMIGSLPAGPLGHRCRERLAFLDPPKGGKSYRIVGHATVHIIGRREGYLQDRIRQLLDLCEQAGPDGWIDYS